VDSLTCTRDSEKKTCRKPFGVSVEARPTSDDLEVRKRRDAMLARVRFHIVILDGNPNLERNPNDDQPGDGYLDYRRTPDPFQQPELAGKPKLDLGAAFSAMDNARAGREPASWYNSSMLFKRIPALGHEVDFDILFNIFRSVDPHAAGPEIGKACGGLTDNDLIGLLGDIPLGWSLSARVQQGMKCVTERVAALRFQTMSGHIPSLRPYRADRNPN
jgi:hypothetical protein